MGIPSVIIDGEVFHDEPFHGDSGLRYEPDDPRIDGYMAMYKWIVTETRKDWEAWKNWVLEHDGPLIDDVFR